MSKAESKTSAPSGSNFSFVPKTFKQLAPFFTYLKWDSANKKISLSVTETPDFDVVRWLEYLTKQDHDCQKSPFSDANNYCILVFRDKTGNGLVQIRFNNITVSSHGCSVFSTDTSSGIDIPPPDLRHTIVLNYGDHSFEELVDEENKITSCDDKEWKKK